MAGGRYDSSLTRVQPFFGTLISRDPSGRSWLPALLSATPRGAERFGALLDNPGSLAMPLIVRGESGRFGCFEYPAAPARELLKWFIDHPDALSWPEGARLSDLTIKLRNALVRDEPPGARERAQERAHELLRTRSALGPGWWRFEGLTQLDCLLMTDRLVVTVEGKRDEPLAPATEWYPRRSQLVRNLEAAKVLADGRQWASLLLSESRRPEASAAEVAALVTAGAPHLTAEQQQELASGYLGNLTWQEACEAVGLRFADLPDVNPHTRPGAAP